MASFYGKHWLDMWADVPVESVKGEWQSKLSGMSGKIVFKAVDYCAENLKFPPTLPEFVALCKANTPSEITKALPRHFTEDEIERNHRRIKDEAEKLAKTPRRDMRQWAVKIMAAPSMYPDIAQRFAREVTEFA